MLFADASKISAPSPRRVWGCRCHGARGQDGTTDGHGPDRTQIIGGAGGIQTGLVRELSYCEAKFGRDASRSEVDSGSCTADLGAA